MAMNKDQVMAELRQRGVEFDPEAKFNDLFTLLRKTREADPDDKPGDDGEGAGDGAGDGAGEGQDGKDDEQEIKDRKLKAGEVKATFLANVKHDGVFYKKDECAILDTESFEKLKSRNLVV